MCLDYYEATGFGMGTIIEQKVAVSSPAEGAYICHNISALMKRLEQEMSYFIPESSISRLNASNGKNTVKIDTDTLRVLGAARRYHDLSNGAFAVTAAPLTALWRECIKTQAVPSDEAIQALLPFVSGSGPAIDEVSCSARINRHQSVELGGIGKGYAADMALGAYRARGVTSAMINLGGNVHTLGAKTNGEPWMIGVQDPRNPRGNCIAALAVSDKSVVTSGDYEKYFESKGKKFHHIIDPRTGYPTNAGLISVTIISDSSMEADALSTAVFVSGLQRGMALIEQVSGAEGVLITENKMVYITKGLHDCFISSRDIKDYTFSFYN